MRGSVYKRGQNWTAVYDEQPDEHGKRRQRSKGGFPTRKDAERFLRAQLARLDTGSYAAPSKLTVADFLEREWLPAVENTLRPLSAQRYRSVIRLYIRPRIGSLRLQGLSAGHLNGLYADLERDGLSVSTRRLVHAVNRPCAPRRGALGARPPQRRSARRPAVPRRYPRPVVDRGRAAPVPLSRRR